MATPGRNEPCPCGSGKKFKKCCERNTSLIQFPSEMVLLQEFLEVKNDFYKYITVREDSINTKIQQIGAKYGFTPASCSSWHDFFFEWFAFDYPFEDNMSLFDIFLKENHREYSNRVLNQLSKWPQSYISVYSLVDTLENGKHIIEDCFTGKQFEIYEPMLEEDFEALFAMRILPATSSYIYFHGTMIMPYDALDLLRETIEDAKNAVDTNVSWEQFLKDEGLLISHIITDLFPTEFEDEDFDYEDFDIPDLYSQFKIRRFLQEPQRALGGKSPRDASFIPKLKGKLSAFLVALDNGKYDDACMDFYPSMHSDYIEELLDGSIDDFKEFIKFELKEKTHKEEALLLIEKMSLEYFPQDIIKTLYVWATYCNHFSPNIKKAGSWAAALEYITNAEISAGRYNQKELAEKYGVSATTVSKNSGMLVDNLTGITQRLLQENQVNTGGPQMVSSTPGAGSKSHNEALMNQIRRELKDKNFNSIEEANEFIQSLMQEGIPRVEATRLSNEDKAQSLLYEAWENKNKRERIKIANEALKIDAACVDAYVILAEDDADTFEAKKSLYLKAIKNGASRLGKEFFKKNMGSFWIMTETRPYMRAQNGLALLYWENGYLQEAAEVFKEMLELNTNDNQGVRYILLPLLLELRLLKEARKLIEAYEEDHSPQWCYNIALYNFMVDNKSKNSTTWLKDALKENQYVPQYLLGFSPMPKTLPEYSQIGGRDEAIIYTYFSSGAWKKAKGALDWLRSLIK